MFRVLTILRHPLSLVAVVMFVCSLGLQALSDGISGHGFHGPAPQLVSPSAAKRSKELKFSKWIDVAKGERHEFPDVAVDEKGHAWITWQSFDNGDPSDLSERILLAPYNITGALDAPIVLEEGPGERFWPRIIAHGRTLWITWNTHTNGHWSIHGIVVKDGKVGPRRVLSSSSRDALRPTLGFDGHHRPWVAWEEERGGQFVVVLRPFEGHGPPMTVSSKGEMNLRPSLAPGPNGGLWIAWDRYDENGYSVWLRPIAGHRMGEPVSIAGGQGGWHLAPSIASAPDGTLWIAWHTNVEPQTGRHTISERIRVLAYRNEKLWEPAFGQPVPIQASLGGQYHQVEDTVEFANIKTDSQGRLWLTARRGQGYFGLVADQEGWHGPFNLARLGWGGRGRDLRLGMGPGGSVFTVARRMHKVSLQILSPPHRNNLGPLKVTALPAADVVFASTQPNSSFSFGQPPSSRDTAVASRLRKRKRFAGSVDQALTVSGAGALSGSVPQDIVQLGAETPEDRPAVVDPQTNEFLLIGDIHTHSWHSDGTGDPDQIFTRARDIRGLDFVALTDHDISNGNVLSPAEFEYIQFMTDFFDRPGEFLAIKGYEWTSKTVRAGGSGHKNVYFPGDEAAFYGYGSGVNDTKTLFELLKEDGAIAIPHHIGWTGTDWENHDPEVQPNVEIVSVHGAFEHANNEPVKPRANLEGMFAQDGLNLGLRFGVVGGSDGHGVAWHYGVSRKENPWETGLTGVYSRSMDRDGIIEALKERRCYASSGTPILLHFQAGGVPMGQALSTTAPPPLYIKVEGSDTLETVFIIRDGEVIKAFPGEGELSLAAFHQEAYLDVGEHYYYVRAVQSDGEVAWSSPVFVEVVQGQLEAKSQALPPL